MSGYIKRAVKYHDMPGFVSDKIPFLDCECGCKVNLADGSLPIFSFICLCGREYNPAGWIINDTHKERQPIPQAPPRTIDDAITTLFRMEHHVAAELAFDQETFNATLETINSALDELRYDQWEARLRAREVRR
jgi:hypothetical protein